MAEMSLDGHREDRWHSTYNFDLDHLCSVAANEHRQPVVAWLIPGTVMRENKGDINWAVLCLQRKVPC